MSENKDLVTQLQVSTTVINCINKYKIQVFVGKRHLVFEWFHSSSEKIPRYLNFEKFLSISLAYIKLVLCKNVDVAGLGQLGPR